MNKLKALSPKIKELQAKYKGDKQKLNTHMMELYKKHGANPMGGCLPIVLHKFLFFFAIYRVLQNAIELKGAAWILWIHDLACYGSLLYSSYCYGYYYVLKPKNYSNKLYRSYAREKL